VQVNGLCGSNSGFNENDLEKMIILYPNPSNNYITIKNKNYQLNSTYTILNSIGQHVLSGQLTGETNIVDISGLSEGIYFVQIAKQELEIRKNPAARASALLKKVFG
jgi:riboflavin synthase alpha subunit